MTMEEGTPWGTIVIILAVLMVVLGVLTLIVSAVERRINSRRDR